MKKVFLGVALVLSSVMFAEGKNISKSELQGIWENDGISLTFEKDTLYIDEIGNEGFGYAYKVEGDTLVCEDDVVGEAYKMVFKIVVGSIDKSAISIRYLDDEEGKYYKFYRKEKSSFIMPN
jgi:hypothetical protein